MRIPVLQFQVNQTVQMVEDVNIFEYLWRTIFGEPIKTSYHFDVVMRVDERYKDLCRSLEVEDVVSLPNTVRLTVWSVDRFGIVKAKTTSFVEDDLRDYHPVEMYLIYPRVHGHLKDTV